MNRAGVLCLGLVLAVLAVYTNHFQNAFHFDDSHTITTNPAIESLRNIPRFFTDASTFSTIPAAQSYRPLVSTSLALDYSLGGGRKPFWFHLSTFLWFLLQLVLMFFLFRRLMDAADPHPSNLWTALLATACYGLHPASAETVNYIIQRGDLYNTVGVVASLLWFIAYPAQRKRGFYLLPAIAAYLSKAPALIYPLILLAYIFLFEQDADRKNWMAAVRTTVPALLVTGAAVILTVMMTPPTFSGGASSAALYRLTQPWVALHYFKSFFVPTELSADSDWTLISSPFSGAAMAGYAFLAVLLWMIVRTSRSRELRPISFGICWFILALLPTSLMPLSDVMNDHRMFFPFVGLALAVFWGLRLLLFGRTARLTVNRAWVRGAVAACLVALVAEGVGAHERNNVWHTEESLWHDVTVKSPKNDRGMQGYAGVLLKMGDTAGAYYYYGLRLKNQGRLAESRDQLETVIRAKRAYFPARYLLMEIYSEIGNQSALDSLVIETLRLNPQDETAHRYMERGTAAAPPASPETILNYSAESCQAGKFEDCLAAAQKALQLRPGWAEAYGNMAAALLSMQRWDEGIQAARQALAIKPDYEAARSNLEFGLQNKGRQ